MKILKKTTFSITIQYNQSSFERQILVEADSMEKALTICREYYGDKIRILNISTYIDILVSMPKTITIEL